MPYVLGPGLDGALPSLHIELDPIPNMIEIQSFSHDSLTGDWYMSQASGDDALVHRFTDAGVFVATMTCIDAGHGSSIDVERDGNSLLVWLSWNTISGGKITARDVCRIQFQPGRRRKSEARSIHVFTDRYTLPALDVEADLLALRTTAGDSETYTIRRLSDCLANRDKPLAKLGPFSTTGQPFQGIAISGTSLYRLTGATNAKTEWQSGKTNPAVVTRFEWATGKTTRLDLTRMGAQDGDAALMSEEPEGVQITAAGLLIGFKRGGGPARRFRIFSLSAKDPPDMALRSQNGYVAARSSNGIPGGTVSIKPKGAPETSFRVRAGDVATVLQYVVDQYQARVENIDLYTKGSGDDWGYAFRPIRGQSTGLSNHASATAIDINSTRHVLGASPSKSFTDKQITACRNIVDELGGAVRWGGDFKSRKDAMHWEISASPGKLAAVADRIRSGAIHGPGKPSPPPVQTPAGRTVAAINTARQNGAESPEVKSLQYRLIASGYKIDADGYWGPKTQTALDGYRSTVLGYSGADAEGPIGLDSLTKLAVPTT